MDLLKLNNEISGMRPAASQAKVHVIHSLTKNAHKLKHKKGDDTELAKNNKKAQRLQEEALIDKVITPDEITKFSLQFDSRLRDEVLNDTSISLPAKAFARIASHKVMVQAVENFRKKYPDWHKHIEKSLEKLGTGARFGAKMKNGRVKAHLVQRRRVEEALDTIRRAQMSWLHRTGNNKIKEELKNKDEIDNDEDLGNEKKIRTETLANKNDEIGNTRSSDKQNQKSKSRIFYEEVAEEEDGDEEEDEEEEASNRSSESEGEEAMVEEEDEDEEKEMKADEGGSEDESEEEDEKGSEDESEEEDERGSEDESEEEDEGGSGEDGDESNTEQEQKRKLIKDKNKFSQGKNLKTKIKSLGISAEEENKQVWKSKQKTGKSNSEESRESKTSDFEGENDESKTTNFSNSSNESFKQKKEKKKLIVPRSREAEVCKFADLLQKVEQVKHSGNLPKDDSRSESEDDSDSPESEDKGVDPFFVTKNNDFLRISAKREEKPEEPVRTGPKWGVEGCENWSGTRRERRDRAFGRTRPKKFPRGGRFSDFSSPPNPNPRRNIQNLDVPGSTANRIPQDEPEKLHPSWEAKRKQQAPLIGFQGKKVKFEDSD